MEVTIAKVLWPEDIGCIIERKNTGNQYIFLHFHTPVQIHTSEGVINTSGNTFIMIDKYSYQKFIVSERRLIHDWMHIEGNLDPLMQNANLCYNAIYEIPTGNFITKLVHETEMELLRSDKYSSEIIEKNIEKLILLLGRIVNDESANEFSQKIKENFHSFRTEIHQTYQKNWTLLEMAKTMNMSRSRFCDTYKQIFGISPKKDLQNIRIDRAKQLLLNTEYTVYEIAEMIGYTNEYYFIRKFKEITGTTPGQYAKTE